MEVSREQVIRHRIAAQQLDREVDSKRPLTDAAILDLGVQDSGRDGASWALANRCVPVASPQALADSDELALVWSLRVSPHYYRRSELVEVMTAISPYDDADLTKRLIGAAKPMVDAGISPRDGMAEIARQLRAVVAEPTVKGEASTALTERLSDPYLRECRPCKAIHAWESTFRMAGLFGGLEIEPNTSPPVLRRIPDWPRRPAGLAPDPTAAPEPLQVIRAYLRLLGPATPSEVAGFLDGATTTIKRHWPDDAVEVKVEGKKKWLLGDLLESRPVVRLLGPYDLLGQGKDRELLVPDAEQRKQLWPILGRPGPVLADNGIVGWWRPRAKGKRLDLEVELWRPRAATKAEIEEQAERLAQHRGLQLGSLTSSS